MNVSSSYPVLLGFALLAGAFLPVQAGINAQLSKFLGHPIPAAIISFAIGTFALLGFALASGVRIPSSPLSLGIPPWMLLGGFLGAVYVAGAAVMAPRLGAATMVAFIIGGQMLASLVIDHYGFIGFPTHHISLFRIAGVILIFLGVFLIQRF